MSTLLDDAVRALRNLPQNMQEAAARAIIEYEASAFADDTMDRKDQSEAAEI